MRYNIRDLYKANGKAKPFLGDATNLTQLPFMAEYLGKIAGGNDNVYANIDRRFARLFASFEPTYNADDIGDATVEEVLAEFKDDIMALLVTNMKKYTQYYELMRLEYNPIENYNMVEGGKDSTNTVSKTQATEGNKSQSTSYGQMSTSTDYGAIVDTVEAGAVTTTEDVGQRTDTTTGKVSGYNDASLIDANASESVNGQQTNTSTTNPHTDKNTTAQHTDTSTMNAHEDTVTTQQSTPSTTSVIDNVATDHNLTRTGNIGVTTTQQMMEQEVKIWDVFNFYQKIFEDIIKSLCNLNDGGYDVHLTPLMNVYMKGE